mgnify:CR=1 FL=1
MLDNEKYVRDGYVVSKALITPEQINECLAVIRGLQPKVLVPFSDEAWGFGSLKNIDPFEDILEIVRKKLEQMKLVDKKIKLNHLVSNRKPAWIGPEVEYHQEVLNYNLNMINITKQNVRQLQTRDLIQLIRSAAEDKNIPGVFIDFSNTKFLLLIFNRY